MRRRASVQRAHLGLEGIEDDVLRVSGGQYRAVLEVAGLNFGLQGEADQEATIAGFAAFLNGLSFPIQVVVRALPVDLEGYVANLERRTLQLPGALADLARDHAAALRRLARSRTLIERHFYVVVPAQTQTAANRSLWPFGRPPHAPEEATARKQLTFRCDEVGRQLGRCGLSARRLGNLELVQLFYACWCPELARVQRVRRELADHTALVVRASARRERSP